MSLPRPKKLLFPGTVYASDAERAWHTAKQFPLLAWSSLGVGFMSGAFTPDSPQ